MFDTIRRDHFLKTHSNFRKWFLLKLRPNLSEDAKRHLERGLIVRLGMMEEAILTLDAEIGKSEKPIEHYLANRLTLFLNAYYLNLAGSLDNLVWALTYEHNLVDDTDEDNKQHRQFAQLLGKKFLCRLRQNHLEKLSDKLQPFQDWYWDMRKLRDPAAHRVPLFVPHSVYSEDDVKLAQKLDKEAAELIRQGEQDNGMKRLYQSHKLGKHMPIFVSEAPKIQRYDLARQVDLDHGNWLQVVEVVLRVGFQQRHTL